MATWWDNEQRRRRLGAVAMVDAQSLVRGDRIHVAHREVAVERVSPGANASVSVGLQDGGKPIEMLAYLAVPLLPPAVYGRGMHYFEQDVKRAANWRGIAVLLSTHVKGMAGKSAKQLTAKDDPATWAASLPKTRDPTDPTVPDLEPTSYWTSGDAAPYAAELARRAPDFGPIVLVAKTLSQPVRGVPVFVMNDLGHASNRVGYFLEDVQGPIERLLARGAVHAPVGLDYFEAWIARKREGIERKILDLLLYRPLFRKRPKPNAPQPKPAVRPYDYWKDDYHARRIRAAEQRQTAQQERERKRGERSRESAQAKRQRLAKKLGFDQELTVEGDGGKTFTLPMRGDGPLVLVLGFHEFKPHVVDVVINVTHRGSGAILPLRRPEPKNRTKYYLPATPEGLAAAERVIEAIKDIAPWKRPAEDLEHRPEIGRAIAERAYPIVRPFMEQQDSQ